MSRGAAVDDTSRGGCTEGARLCTDHREIGTVSVWKTDRELSGLVPSEESSGDRCNLRHGCKLLSGNGFCLSGKANLHPLTFTKSNLRHLEVHSMQATKTIFALLVWGVPLLGYSALAEDPIGAATLTKLSSCPAGGLANGTCYKATISNCPETTGNFVAAIKVNAPPNGQKPLGAVLFTTGGAGNGYYDGTSGTPDTRDTRCNAQGNCGLLAVQTVNNAGYETIQTNFSDPLDSATEPVGWLTGPAADGPRALACRYATLVHAVWTNILRSSTTRPVCATGNSAGSAVIAYSLTQYGLGSLSGPGPLLSMVEATSGPPMARIDHGLPQNASDHDGNMSQRLGAF
jgi:hypothetical protein